MKTFNLFLLCGLVCLFAYSTLQAQDSKVLIFSKTKGFRHASIEHGRAVIADLCKKNNIAVDSTEDAALFTLKSMML